jgi:hypothetical protein
MRCQLSSWGLADVQAGGIGNTDGKSIDKRLPSATKLPRSVWQNWVLNSAIGKAKAHR